MTSITKEQLVGVYSYVSGRNRVTSTEEISLDQDGVLRVRNGDELQIENKILRITYAFDRRSYTGSVVMNEDDVVQINWTRSDGKTSEWKRI